MEELGQEEVDRREALVDMEQGVASDKADLDR